MKIKHIPSWEFNKNKALRGAFVQTPNVRGDRKEFAALQECLRRIWGIVAAKPEFETPSSTKPRLRYQPLDWGLGFRV